MLILFRLVQFSNILLVIKGMDWGRVTRVNEEQPMKAPPAMEVTVLGMVRLVILLQP